MKEIVALRLSTWLTCAALGVVIVAGGYMVGRIHHASLMRAMADMIQDEQALTESGFFAQAVPMRIVVTGYAAVEGLTDSTPTITAIGLATGRRICAVDPAAIPLRSWVLVPDLGLCYAGDTGSKVKGAHVDWLFETVEDAREWGRKTRTAYVVRHRFVDRR